MTIEENPEFEQSMRIVQEPPVKNTKWGRLTQKNPKDKLKAFENDIVRDEFDDP